MATVVCVCVSICMYNWIFVQAIISAFRHSDLKLSTLEAANFSFYLPRAKLDPRLIFQTFYSLSVFSVGALHWLKCPFSFVFLF